MIPKIPPIEHPEKYADFDLPREKLLYALEQAKKKIDGRMIPDFTDCYPEHSSVHNVYAKVPNDRGWNCGFWSGILWHMYEMTGEEKYKQIALAQIPGYLYRIENKLGVNHHDMGFVFTPSCVAAYKLAGSEDGKKAAVLAADNLLSRYHEKGKFLQAWATPPLIRYQMHHVVMPEKLKYSYISVLCLTTRSSLALCTPWTVALQALPSMGILQARILEWVAMPSYKGSS